MKFILIKCTIESNQQIIHLMLQEHLFPRLGIEYSAKSIFAEATSNDAKNPASFYVINNTTAGKL